MPFQAFRSAEEFVVVCMPLTEGAEAKWVEFRYARNELSIIDRRVFTTWEECAHSKGRPIVLSIHSRGVVNRTSAPHASPGTALQEAFPTTEPGSLIASCTPTPAGTSISAARTEQVDRIIEVAHECGFRVVGLHIGTAHLGALLPLIQGTGGASHDLPWHVTTNGMIEGHATIGGQHMTGLELLAFASAMAHLTGTTDLVGGPARSLAAGVSEERYRRLYRAMTRYAVVICALLVLGLLLLRTMIDDRHEQALRASMADQGQAQVARQLKAEIATRDRMMSLIGVHRELRAGYKADRIAALVPPGIQLTRVAIAPTSKGRSDEELQVHQDSIVVQGLLPDPIELNALVSVMAELDFVKAVHIRSVLGQPRSAMAAFTIEVRTR